MSRGSPIRVLVVDDDERTAGAHAEYVRRIDGFEVAGVAFTVAAALAVIAGRSADRPIELVLLDLNLPDGHGIELARHLRSHGVPIDIIAITAVRQTDVVHDALAAGVVHYLIKPFSLTTFREKLGGYLAFRRQLDAGITSASQADVDAMFSSFRAPAALQVPKGLSTSTLDVVADLLRGSSSARSANEVAEPLHMSRVTARRYLEHLVAAGQVVRMPRYGSPGRPEHGYRWVG